MNPCYYYFVISNNTINAKEIRQDLDRFLDMLKSGKPVTIIYRSKPYVTVSSHIDDGGVKAGSKEAVKNSLTTARLLRESNKAKAVNLDYHQLLEQKYDRA